ncbi:MAG: hypothetical protein ABIR05_00475 [Luteimonas sp.]
MKHHPLATLLIAAMAMATLGCDRASHSGQASNADDALDSLPQPASDGGPVTAMPDAPGPGPIGTGVAGMGAGTLPPTVEGGVAPGPDPADGAGVAAGPATAEPSANDAVAVLDGYYAAIAQGQYSRARGMWSGAGESSGQTLAQFAAGFASTVDIAFKPGTPGRVDAAAGSRFVEVPVAIQATHGDGSVHQYVGSYTLRRAVVDGASAEQRAWRIASADIREVRN